MTEQYWIDWCEKQLAEISGALLTQGFTPTHIEKLNRVSPEFHRAFSDFQAGVQRVMEDMTSNPEGYEHYETFATIRKEFLAFTNQHRQKFLNLKTARVA